MPIKPSTGGAAYEPMPSGAFPARLYSVIHIGTVESEYQGQKSQRDLVCLSFEFPTELKVFKEENGEQPYVLSREFTNSLTEKANLRKFLEGWQGKKMTDMEAIDTDLEQWVGKEGLANVVHTQGKNGNTYANIEAMSPLPKGLDCPPAITAPFILNYHEAWTDEKFASLPLFIREKMGSSEQFLSKFGNKANFADGDVDIEEVAF